MMRKITKRQANFIMTEVTGIFLALAVAFFFVAMPADVFGRLVSASGLPVILPAAAPPLGDTARMIVGALAGSIAGMAVILLFILLDPQPKKQTETVRPFYAGFDLSQVESLPTETRPLGRPVEKEEAVEAAFEIIEEPIKPTSSDNVSQPIFIDFQAIRIATQSVSTQSPSPVDRQPLDLSQWKIAEPEPQARPITAPDRRADDESIYALMKRLEAGLERRAENGAGPSKAPEINRSGVGVRTTLDELRKMAIKR